MKIALLVAYDGTGLHGFARQRSTATVQGLLEDRLSMLLRGPVTTTGAGRTDAGVHAAGQVVSFDAPGGVDPRWLAHRLNRWLAPQISIRVAAVVPATFDARFSAVRREYEYRLYVATAPDPFRDRFALHLPERPKLGLMRDAARGFLGRHDFAAFCRKGQTSTERRLRTLGIVRRGDELVVRIVADSFCHQMVRSIVGLLLEIGRGRRPAEDARTALASRDRAQAGPVAPARGLHLVRVVYRPDPFGATP